MIGEKHVSITVGDDGNISEIKFSGEETPRTHPSGNLSETPMSVEGYPMMTGFQTITVFVFRDPNGVSRICVKKQNCDWYCS